MLEDVELHVASTWGLLKRLPGQVDGSAVVSLTQFVNRSDIELIGFRGVEVANKLHYLGGSHPFLLRHEARVLAKIDRHGPRWCVMWWRPKPFLAGVP
jgi:hypothetical protein